GGDLEGRGRRERAGVVEGVHGAGRWIGEDAAEIERLPSAHDGTHRAVAHAVDGGDEALLGELRTPLHPEEGEGGLMRSDMRSMSALLRAPSPSVTWSRVKKLRPGGYCRR